MNGFFGFLLRTWFERARGRVFGLVLLVATVESLLSVFFLVSSWFDARSLERLTREGTTAEATIENVDVRSNRYGTTVYLNLAWNDAAGARLRQEVRLHEDFASKIVSGGRALRQTLPIKYLADEPGANVLFLDDANRQIAANRELMRIGKVGLGLCVLALAILCVVRRHVRRKHPHLPASFTSWPNFRNRRPTNTFMRVFWQHSYFTIPLVVVLIYSLKYYGLSEILENLTGWTEYWVGLMLAAVMIFTLSACGWCYDRYGEWRSRLGSERPTQV